MSTLAAVSLLNQAVDLTRQQMHEAATPQAKMRALWAGTRNARGFGAGDSVAEGFIALGMEFQKQLGRHAAEHVQHVVSWACRDMNPFED
jgi:hypothetical protein